MSGFEMILPYLRTIEHLIGNEEVSEIMVNCNGQVFAERAGLIELITQCSDFGTSTASGGAQHRSHFGR